MEQYNVDYFIHKFEVIPESKFWVGKLSGPDGSHCANGWCGVTPDELVTKEFNDETKSFQKILSVLEVTPTYPQSLTNYKEYFEAAGYSIKAADINNGNANEYQQPTPKQRILAALYDVKAQQEALNQCKALVKLSHYNQVVCS